jgi:hypothetical protein
LSDNTIYLPHFQLKLYVCSPGRIRAYAQNLVLVAVCFSTRPYRFPMIPVEFWSPRAGEVSRSRRSSRTQWASAVLLYILESAAGRRVTRWPPNSKSSVIFLLSLTNILTCKHHKTQHEKSCIFKCFNLSTFLNLIICQPCAGERFGRALHARAKSERRTRFLCGMISSVRTEWPNAAKASLDNDGGR